MSALPEAGNAVPELAGGVECGAGTGVSGEVPMAAAAGEGDRRLELDAPAVGGAVSEFCCVGTMWPVESTLPDKVDVSGNDDVAEGVFSSQPEVCWFLPYPNTCLKCCAKSATPSKLGWSPSAPRKRLTGRSRKPWSM